MRKDFDRWNEQKKRLNGRPLQKYVAGEVWWASLGLNIGSEQDGSNKEFQRPVVILRGLSRETRIIVPLTTSKSSHPLRVPIGDIEGKKARAILSQLRVIDTRRLTIRMCRLGPDFLKIIRKAARNLF